MKKMLVCVLSVCMFMSGGCIKNREVKELPSVIQNTDAYENTMKRDILCIMMAYPGHVKSVEKMDNGIVYLVMKSGKRILYDDRKNKSFDMKMNSPDIQDMMEQLYPLNDIAGLMPVDFDPGRIRVYPLLMETYGSSKGQVQSNLVNVSIGYKNLSFNKNNMAADSLKAVMKELVPLAGQKSRIYSCVFPASGTFNYRNISGTGLLSAHSFGIAIDLASDKRDYWKWTTREQGQNRILSYPKEIVHLFEKNNFIWGGKWGHFDILHFEYRPEVIYKARYFSMKPTIDDPWYSGINATDDEIKRYIEMIDNVL